MGLQRYEKISSYLRQLGDFGKMTTIKNEEIKVVAFDADDTLWENEGLFRAAEREVAEVLKKYGDYEHISSELYKTETKNMPDYGFGAMAYTLSMMETAIRVTGKKLTAKQAEKIIESGRKLLHNPATPLPGVTETLSNLKGRYRLAIITKGDLFDQEKKIVRSGLKAYFDEIFIVSDKDREHYEDLCSKMSIRPPELLSVGNSFKSDIAPVLEIGGWAVHIPSTATWQLEHTEEYDHPRLHKIGNISLLPALLGL